MSDHVPDNCRYTSDHEWVRLEDADVLLGITHYAQDQLGDVVYVDLPASGAELDAGQPFGEVESTKSVSDLFAPIAGVVVARNEALDDRPELINEDPYGEGWMLRITPNDPGDLDGLLDAAAYLALTDG